MEILSIVLPALLVLLTAYLMMDKLTKNEAKRRDFELRKMSVNTVTPLRLRAYERLILVLERTTPATLLVNTIKPGMTSLELHSELLSVLRAEFSHNLSQQIYITDESWNYVQGTRESLLKLINTCASKCKPSDDATVLAELIIQVYQSAEETPTEVAIRRLKNEVRSLM